MPESTKDIYPKREQDKEMFPFPVQSIHPGSVSSFQPIIEGAHMNVIHLESAKPIREINPNHKIRTPEMEIEDDKFLHLEPVQPIRGFTE